jgi:rod shape-determining protein MreC
MAARRSSFARRDSNLALLGALLSGVVIAFALLLLVAQRVNPGLGQAMRGATADALSPILSVARAPVEAVRRVGGIIGDHRDVVARNRRLEAELKDARARAAAADSLAAEVKRLEGLLALRRPERRLVTTAVASSVSAGAGQRRAILSAGASDGVRARMPVIAAGGLAGRTTDVGIAASRMQLLTDADSRVPVKVLRTGWTGLAVGTGGTLLEFQFDVASGADTIRPGDRLVTSGDGGLYPPGVPVAVIVDAAHNPPLARPLANPTGLGTVMVEAPWLPPPPTLLALPPARPEADRPAPPPATPAPAPATARETLPAAAAPPTTPAAR